MSNLQGVMFERFSKLIAEGVESALAGRWRAAADSYKAVYEFEPETKRIYDHKFYYFVCYCSALSDGDNSATEEDLSFLKKVGRDASRPIIFRCQAERTRGRCRGTANADREGAARSYRRCINIINAATPEEMNTTECNLDDEGMPAPEPVEPILTQYLFECTNLLAMLERRPFKLGQLRSGYTLDSLGLPVTQGPEEPFHMIVGGPVQSVRHSACAACGKPSTAPLQCTGCRSVSYCDRTCQKEHWASHKAECRGLREGDYALLIALRSRPELNGVRVLLHCLEETGRWLVSIRNADWLESGETEGTELKVLPKNLSLHIPNELTDAFELTNV